MARYAFFGLFAAVALLSPAAATAAPPAVARPAISSGNQSDWRGLVFFVAADSAVGVAAVGTAHGFDANQLARAGRVDFYLGSSRRRVTSASGFLAPPGRPFNLPGGSIRGDYFVYALDTLPLGARVLEIERSHDVLPGERVRVLGVPADARQDEEEIEGVVVDVSASRIDVDAKVTADLQGWGGAPVLSSETQRVIGLLQAYFPQGNSSRLVIAPISGVVEALGKSFAGGAGRPFAGFAGPDTAQPNLPPPPSASTAHSLEEENRARLQRTLEHGAPAQEETVVTQGARGAMKVRATIDYPGADDAVKPTACGAFVAGRAMAYEGELKRFDVAIVIDTSGSTSQPSGADINGNGIIGKPRLGVFGNILGGGSTDSGDTILAAEVAAARRLLRGLDPRATRATLVTFAGEPDDHGGGGMIRLGGGPEPPAITVEPLTNDYERIERGLDEILDRGPRGMTHMAAGLDQATIELLGLSGALSTPDSNSEKVTLFFTDGEPTLPYAGTGSSLRSANTRAVLRAANRSSRGRIKIHSYAIGPEALEGPVATVEMARRTHGTFTPVRNPGTLVEAIDGVDFTNLSELTVRNTTTGKVAEKVRTTADGTWAALIEAAEGENEIEVIARAADGGEARKLRRFVVDPNGAPFRQEGAPFAAQRNLLLAECLRGIKQLRVAAEEERAEQVRKELLVEIERERAKAAERAAQQRKELQIEVDEP